MTIYTKIINIYELVCIFIKGIFIINKSLIINNYLRYTCIIYLQTPYFSFND